MPTARFSAEPEYCEAYGNDLITGAPLEPSEYRAMNPTGKAIIRAAEYVPPHEPPTADHPFALITGRTLYQFHTRTKTGRAPQLRTAAPEPWVELSGADADRLGLREGDVVEVVTPRGSVTAPCRITGIRNGVLFVPFHYGYWDTDGADDHHRAANELTLTDWDPCSKQPIFKTAAALLQRIRSGSSPAPAPTTAASAPLADIPPTTGGPHAEVNETVTTSEAQ